MTLHRVAFALAFAVATFASFPHPFGERVVDLGIVLGWLPPALLLLAVRGLRPRAAAGVAFGAGVLAHAAVLHWIFVVTVVYGEAPVVVGVLAPVGLAVYAASFHAAFGAAAAHLERRGRDDPFVLAALWAALDHGRHFVLTGFPWGVLGYAQWRNPALMELAPFTSVIGLSFVTALGSFAALATVGAIRRRERLPRPALASLAVVALVHAVGGIAAARSTDQDGPRLRVGLLQGNIDQGVKWSPDWAGATLGIYEELTRAAVADGAQVVVWPETAVPGSIETDPAVRGRLESLAATTGAVLVVGAVGIERDPDAAPDCDPRHCWHFFDSAYVFDRAGDAIDRYDKAHLVPFGEYVPLRELIGIFISAVARGIAPDNVTAGAGPRAVELPPPPGAERRALTVGIPICYELLFPDGVRRFVHDGARALLAITNDAWYGRTGAPYQFLAITAMRSAESRVWTARAANTGVTAVLDDRGRVRARTRIFERDRIVFDLPLLPAEGARSFYVRHGDVFAWGCWGVGLLALLVPGSRAGRKST